MGSQLNGGKGGDKLDMEVGGNIKKGTHPMRNRNRNRNRTRKQTHSMIMPWGA